MSGNPRRVRSWKTPKAPNVNTRFASEPLALGWHADRIVVIDSDLGQSGASAADREGFQRLVAEVGMGHAGLVIGLEVSRLARNSRDWHRLLEICALTDTLILDEDGLYDPAHFNDRLLLGLKGTMSEAELHVMQARMRGGILSKARRGELQVPIPVGFLYDAQGRMMLDPDQQVQQSIRFLFESFRRLGSAWRRGESVPREQAAVPAQAERRTAGRGADVGRVRHHANAVRPAQPSLRGSVRVRAHSHAQDTGRIPPERLPEEQWHTLLRAHAGYISWEEYQENQRRLQENAHALGPDRRRGAHHGKARRCFRVW